MGVNKQNLEQKLASFQGEIQEQSLTKALYDDDDIAFFKQSGLMAPEDDLQALMLNWVPTFIQGGGFQILEQVLQDLTTSLGGRKPEDTLQSQVERGVLS